MKRIIDYALIFCAIALVVVCIVMSSCGLARIQSTEAKYYQRGDTTVQIITKTTSTIDAKTSVPITNLIK